MSISNILKILNKFYFSGFRVFRISARIMGSIYYKCYTSEKLLSTKFFFAYILHVDLKYLKNSYSSGFRVFRINDCIMELLYYK